MKKQKNSRGFIAPESFLIIILISIIGLTGWYVRQSSSNARASLANASNAEANPAKFAKKAKPTEKTSTKRSSANKSVPVHQTNITTPVAAHPNADDKESAKNKLLAIHSELEAYYVVGLYYPSNIAVSNFTDICYGDCSDESVPPPGIKFIYSPTPGGCTTSAHNCREYTLTAVETNGSLVYRVKSTHL